MAPLRWAPIHRVGQLASSVRHGIGQIDRAIHVGSKVFHAVKEHVPPKIRNAAERGLSDYEGVRQKIRESGMV